MYVPSLTGYIQITPTVLPSQWYTLLWHCLRPPAYALIRLIRPVSLTHQPRMQMFTAGNCSRPSTGLVVPIHYQPYSSVHLLSQKLVFKLAYCKMLERWWYPPLGSHFRFGLSDCLQSLCYRLRRHFSGILQTATHNSNLASFCASRIKQYCRLRRLFGGSLQEARQKPT